MNSNPYDFNPYSPFSNDMLQNRGMYEPEKIVMRQMDKRFSSLPDQLYLSTYKPPKEYSQRQYFNPSPSQSPLINSSEGDNNGSDVDDFFTWFIQSTDFYIVLLFILIVIVVNFIVMANRRPYMAFGVITPVGETKAETK
jgi:hypothetical protein